MILLNMFGVQIEVKEGTVIRIVPNLFDSEEEEDEIMDEEIQVIVESIRFIVTRSMLEQRNDTLLSENYFSSYLRFHTNHRNVIPITPQPRNTFGATTDEDDILGKAMYYPIIFDFLRRRVENPNKAPLHICELPDDTQTRELNALEDFFFTYFVRECYLPQGPVYAKTRYIATPPPQHLHEHFEDFIGKRKSLYQASMCYDPEFVRLVLQVQPYNQITHQNEVRTDAVDFLKTQPLALHIMNKYDMEIEDIINSKLHPNVSSCEKIFFSRKREGRTWFLRLEQTGINPFVV